MQIYGKKEISLDWKPPWSREQEDDVMMFGSVNIHALFNNSCVCYILIFSTLDLYDNSLHYFINPMYSQHFIFLMLLVWNNSKISSRFYYFKIRANLRLTISCFGRYTRVDSILLPIVEHTQIAILIFYWCISFYFMKITQRISILFWVHTLN